MDDLLGSGLSGRIPRYSTAVLVATAFLLLQHGLVYSLGLTLPLFLGSYPAVFLVSILCGLRPGLLAVGLCCAATDFWFVQPIGRFSIDSRSDAVALGLFATMGVLICLLADHWRQAQKIISTIKLVQAARSSQEKIRCLNAFRQLAFEVAELSAWEVCLDSQQIIWDDLSESFLGFQPGERVTVAALLMHIHPEDRDNLHESFKTALRDPEGEVWSQQFRALKADGSVRWLLSRGRVLFAGSGETRKAERFAGVTMDLTSLRLAEEAQSISTTKLETALASISDSVMITDSTGSVVQFNDAFAKLHRFESKAECPQSIAEYPTILDVRPPGGEPLPLDRWALPRALRGESESNTEYCVRRKDTGESWVGSYSFSPIFDKAGSVVGSVFVGRDITEQKMQERELEDYRKHLERRIAEQTQELRASETRYHGLFEILPVGVVVQTRTGEITDANPAAAAILRLSMEQIRGKTSRDSFWRAVRPDGSPFEGEEHPAMKTLATGIAEREVIMGLGGADDRSWITINSFPLYRNDEALPHSVLTSFQDITRQVENDKVIQTLVSQYQNILSAATEVAIFTTDSEGRFTFFNVGAELMLGYTEDEAVGRPWEELFRLPEENGVGSAANDDPRATPVSLDSMRDLVDRKGSLLRELKVKRRDGTSLVVSAAITPVRREDGATTGYLTVLQDITDKAELEEELRLTARTDHLTDLANRRAFEEAIDLELKRTKRFKTKCSLLMVDIDNLKKINDVYGHQTGDRALTSLANVLKKNARSTDLAARIGGDEFVVLLVGSDLGGAMVIAEHLRVAIEQIPLAVNMGQVSMSASFGASILMAKDSDWRASMNRADKAMYRAKAGGRNRIVGIDAEGEEFDISAIGGRRRG